MIIDFRYPENSSFHRITNAYFCGGVSFAGMRVTIKKDFQAVDSDGNTYEVVGVELSPRIFWSKSDSGWEGVFERELVENREVEVLRVWDGKVTIKP